MSAQLAILGASTRAAACSAARAGYRVWTADLFADADQPAAAHVVRASDYPRGLFRALAEAPPGPWLYTGGLENYPALIDRAAGRRPLLGNSGATLRRARDPMVLCQLLHDHGFRYPAIVPSNAPDECRRNCLFKPLRSSGGIGVARFGTNRQIGIRQGYWQQYIEGTPCSAAFVAASGRSILLGTSRQLTGPTWCGAAEFAYSGSIGPAPISDEVARRLETLGNVLAAELCLHGLFGVDFIRSAGEIWTLEINPRYTASLEVLERAFDFSAVVLHVAACRYGRLPTSNIRAKEHTCAGKAILYARRGSETGPAFLDRVHEWNAKSLLPRVADIPHLGQHVLQGHPVATVLAEGRDEQNVLGQLRRDVEVLAGLLE